MKTVSLAQLQQEARLRPHGYLADVLAHSRSDGLTIQMEDRIYDRLRHKYQAIEDNLSEPTVEGLLSNFAIAIAGWATAGFPVTSQSDYARRTEECAKCSFWNEKARQGLGKCTHHRCGCTRFKRWLQSEKCPIGRWPE